MSREHLEPEPADAVNWDAGEHANWLYDALSDVLRGYREVFPDADAAFTALDEWLRGGGALPGPWRNAERPASNN